MADIVERLREAHPNSQQRFAGSTILLDAADEIARLRLELEFQKLASKPLYSRRKLEAHCDKLEKALTRLCDYENAEYVPNVLFANARAALDQDKRGGDGNT